MESRSCPTADDPRVRDRVRVALGDDLQAPSQARRAVRQVLVAWRLPGLVDSVVLAVSELVTNALRHGRPPVHLVLHRHRDRVRLEVHDARPTPLPSERLHATSEAESGRGLAIVNALAVDVGCHAVPGDGKVVHACFTAGPEHRQP